MSAPLQLAVIAQAEAASSAERVEALKMQLHDLLGSLQLEHVLIVAAIGLVSLTYGWRFYYLLAVLMCGAIGFLAGDALAYATQSQVSDSGWYPIAMRVVGAMGFGAIAIPYLRLAIFVIAGVVGGYSGYIASLYIAPGSGLLFTGLGFVSVGLVSMAFFQLMVVVGTAAIGSTSLVLAGTWLLFAYNHEGYAWLLQREGLLPLAVLVGAVAGVFVQLQMVPEGGMKEHYRSGREKKGGAEASGEASAPADESKNS